MAVNTDASSDAMSIELRDCMRLDYKYQIHCVFLEHHVKPYENNLNLIYQKVVEIWRKKHTKPLKTTWDEERPL